MFMYRSKVALYGIALMMLGCGGGDIARPASITASVDTADSGAESMDKTGRSEADGEDGDDTKEGDKDESSPAMPSADPPDEIGLPCDLKVFLSRHCQVCHGADAKNGTPLLTRDQLLRPSKKDPAMMVIQRALLRVTSAETPMPPLAKADPVGQADIQMLQDWVDQGTPAAGCADTE